MKTHGGGSQFFKNVLIISYFLNSKMSKIRTFENPWGGVSIFQKCLKYKLLLDPILNKTWSSVSNSSLSKTIVLCNLENLKFRRFVLFLQKFWVGFFLLFLFLLWHGSLLPELSQKPMSSVCVKFQPSSAPPSDRFWWGDLVLLVLVLVTGVKESQLLV